MDGMRDVFLEVIPVTELGASLQHCTAIILTFMTLEVPYGTLPLSVYFSPLFMA